MIRLHHRVSGMELHVGSDEQATFWESLGYRRAAPKPVAKEPTKKAAPKAAGKAKEG